jgi:outer membrane protein OmpA-like peptidoglycan-associated protein
MRILGLAVCLMALAGVAGCAQNRSLVVLLPDADGQVGTIHIATNRGFIAVDKAYHSVNVRQRKTPETPRVMLSQDVDVLFAHALAAEPPQRFRYKKQVFYYQRNAVELTSDSQEVLPTTIQELMLERPVKIYLVGHADRVGTEEYNQQLSRQRAITFQQALVAGGIAPDMIAVSFLGESKPRIDTPDEVEEPRNRRVVMVTQYKIPE